MEKLAAEGFKVRGVVTQPDRPAGRGLLLRPPPVKQAALRLHLPVFQFENLKQSQADVLSQGRPDILVVAAYGQLLPEKLLKWPRLESLNIHASLLPRHRGPAPLAWAILCGDTETGVTIQKVAPRLDTGDLYKACVVPLTGKETAGELHDRLAHLGAQLLVDVLNELKDGKAKPEPQDDTKATYAPKITTELQRLDWNRSAKEEDRRIRALSPSPGAFFRWRGENIKVFRSEAGEGEGEPGVLLDIQPRGWKVACREGALWLQELQRPGRKRMTAWEAARGMPELKCHERFPLFEE